MADKIVVLRDGEVEQVGRPMDLYFKPANLFVATFLGSPEMNLLPAVVAASRLDLGADGSVALPGATATLASRTVTIGIRPHDIVLCPVEGADIAATVARVELTGAETVLTCRLPSGGELCVVVSGVAAQRPGEPVGLALNTAHLHCFDRDTGKALPL